MITEDYVSFEVAKLLKEKGFDESTNCFYNINGNFIGNTYYTKNSYTNCYAAPTLQMAMKWLREVCNIEINVSMSALNSDNSREYMFNIFFTNERYLEPSKTKTGFKCYEKAVEAAIKYCLTNLIK